MGVVVKFFPVELCEFLIPACCAKGKVPTSLSFPSLDWCICHHCVSLSYRAHTKETLTCPLGILILVRVETVSSTLCKVFVYSRVTADSLDSLSDTSHFCQNLRLAEVSVYPNQKSHKGWFLCSVDAVKSSKFGLSEWSCFIWQYRCTHTLTSE